MVVLAIETAMRRGVMLPKVSPLMSERMWRRITPLEHGTHATNFGHTPVTPQSHRL